ncbi:MAG: hypothetical protein HGA67_01330 [Candidatus Yonathbacteria bacterium]|nr:hypothetical protein [Candidatus Yonathbacteria bacterium]
MKSVEFPGTRHQEGNRFFPFGDLYVVDMPGSLSRKDRDVLFTLLFPIAQSAFQREVTPAFREDVRRHLFGGGPLMFLADSAVCSAVPRAFCIWDSVWCDQVSALLLSGVCVSRDFQRMGLGTGFIKFAMEYLKTPRTNFLVLRTQNPVMKKTLDDAVGVESFPRVNEHVPGDVSTVAGHIAQALGDSRFESQTLTSPKVYGQSLYGEEIPSLEDVRYRKLFSELISQKEGDAMYCVFRIQNAR